jgi:hypothetical protein
MNRDYTHQRTLVSLVYIDIGSRQQQTIVIGKEIERKRLDKERIDGSKEARLLARRRMIALERRT